MALAWVTGEYTRIFRPNIVRQPNIRASEVSNDQVVGLRLAKVHALALRGF